MSDKTIYTFSYDYWIDGHEDCPCCSGLKFETYQLINVEGDLGHDNELRLEDFQCWWESECYKLALQHYNGIEAEYCPYDGFSEDTIEQVCKELDIEIKIERGIDDQ